MVHGWLPLVLHGKIAPERFIMKRLFVVACLLFTAACGTEAETTSDNSAASAGPPPGFINDVQVTVDDMEREYDLYVPDNASTEPRPLLLAFHGGSGRDYPYPQQSKFHTLADTEGFLVAYPLAVLIPPNEGEWQLNTRDGARHDIRYVEAIID